MIFFFVDRFFVFNAYLILHTICNASYAYALGALFRNTKIATNVSHIANILLYTVGGGVFVNRRALPVVLSWVPYISWYFYTAEGLLTNQWSGVRFACHTNETLFLLMRDPGFDPAAPAVRLEPNACPYPDGEAVLEALAMSVDNVYSNLIILVVYTIALRCFAVLFLYMKVRLALK